MRISDWSSDVCSSDLIDWLVVDLSVHRSGMRLRRIARIVVRRAAEEMLRVVGASVVAEVVQAADPVQLLGMSQPLQILRNLVVLGEALRERDVVWRAVEIERIVPEDRTRPRLNSSN